MHKKTRNILMIIYILVLIAVVSGATFAYFSVIKVSEVPPAIRAQSATTEWLLFSTGDPIEINATQENFGSGMGNLNAKTNANITLKTTNSNQNVKHNYNVFLEIDNNEFVYSTPSQEAELLLTVKDPLGNLVTSILGLKYVTVGEVSGFDITEKTGRIFIADNYEIATNSSTEQTWDIEVTFVNLNSDQQVNAGKNFISTLQVEKSV